MQLHWKPNLSTSALHAAESCWRYPERVNDSEVLANLRPYADRLGRWCMELLGDHSRAIWDSLIATGSAIASNRELASVVLRDHGVPDTDAALASLLAGLITDVEAAFGQLFPRYLEQSSFRLRPLQEQWLGFGRGLLAQWKRLVRQDSLISECTVIGLQPVLGGFGRAHRKYGLVRMEAVLTNALPEIPEVVRLGWLLAQMESCSNELFPSESTADANSLISLAAIPSILAAGQELELTRCNAASVALALQQWDVESPIAVSSSFESPVALAAELIEWWHSSERAEADWQQAARMLAKRLYG